MKLDCLQLQLSTVFHLQTPRRFLLEVQTFYSGLSLPTAGLLFLVTFRWVTHRGVMDCGAIKLYSFLYCSIIRVNFYLSLYLWHLRYTLSFLSLQVSSISGSTMIHFISEDIFSHSLKFIYFMSFPWKRYRASACFWQRLPPLFPTCFHRVLHHSRKFWVVIMRPMKNFVWDSMETTHCRESLMRQRQRWLVVEKPVSTRKAFTTRDRVIFPASWSRSSIPPISQPCKAAN